MTRFVKYFIHADSFNNQAQETIFGHFGNDKIQIGQTFQNWQEKIILVLSSDKTKDALNSLTNGQYIPIGDEAYEAYAMAKTHPIAILDPKYAFMETTQGKSLDNFTTARFAHLKSKIKVRDQKSYFLFKIGLKQPIQQDVKNLLEHIDQDKCNDILGIWKSRFANLNIPNVKEEKQKPPADSATASAPPEDLVQPPVVPSPNAANFANLAFDPTQIVNALENINSRINEIDLNSRNNVMLAGNPTSNSINTSKLNITKSLMNFPKVDLEVEGSLNDGLDSLVNVSRLVPDKDMPTLILTFLTTNNMTDVIPDLSNPQLTKAKLFRNFMLERYGSPDPVATFNLIQERHMEDPSTLIGRIKRAWNRVKNLDVDTEIPNSEVNIIRDRFIKALKNDELRKKLRMWSTPYQKLLQVTRDFKNAEKLEENNTQSTSGAAMIAYESCKHCGLAHASHTCRSNPKQKANYNKKLRNNKPVSRSQVRIIPDRYGSDNQYQPVQRRPLVNTSYGNSNQRTNKNVTYHKYAKSNSNINRPKPNHYGQKSNYYGQKPNYYGQKTNNYVPRPNGGKRPWKSNLKKNFGKSPFRKDSYLAMRDDESDYFEYPFNAVEGMSYEEYHQ